MDLARGGADSGGGGGGGGSSAGPAQLDLSDDRTHMHVATLQFMDNPELEHEFCRDFFRKYAVAVRNSLLLAWILWALFVLLDISKVRANASLRHSH